MVVLIVYSCLGMQLHGSQIDEFDELYLNKLVLGPYSLTYVLMSLGLVLSEVC